MSKNTTRPAVNGAAAKATTSNANFSAKSTTTATDQIKPEAKAAPIATPKAAATKPAVVKPAVVKPAVVKEAVVDTPKVSTADFYEKESILIKIDSTAPQANQIATRLASISKVLKEGKTQGDFATAGRMFTGIVTLLNNSTSADFQSLVTGFIGWLEAEAELKATVWSNPRVMRIFAGKQTNVANFLKALQRLTPKATRVEMIDSMAFKVVTECLVEEKRPLFRSTFIKQ